MVELADLAVLHLLVDGVVDGVDGVLGVALLSAGQVPCVVELADLAVLHLLVDGVVGGVDGVLGVALLRAGQVPCVVELADLVVLLEDVLLLLLPEGGEAGDRGAVLEQVSRPVPDELEVPGVVLPVAAVLAVPAQDELVVLGVVRGAVLELVVRPVPDELEVPGVVHLVASVLVVPAQVA